MQDARSNPMIEAGTEQRPSPACDGEQLLLWPDTYDPEQQGDVTPYDAPERAYMYLHNVKGKAKGGLR